MLDQVSLAIGSARARAPARHAPVATGALFALTIPACACAFRAQPSFDFGFGIGFGFDIFDFSFGIGIFGFDIGIGFGIVRHPRGRRVRFSAALRWPTV